MPFGNHRNVRSWHHAQLQQAGSLSTQQPHHSSAGVRSCAVWKGIALVPSPGLVGSAAIVGLKPTPVGNTSCPSSMPPSGRTTRFRAALLHRRTHRRCGRQALPQAGQESRLDAPHRATKLLYFAGSNGAGKTTLPQSSCRTTPIASTFINSDWIAHGLSPFDPELP